MLALNGKPTVSAFATVRSASVELSAASAHENVNPDEARQAGDGALIPDIASPAVVHALPPEFPAAAQLIAAGHDSLESVRDLAGSGGLTAIDGIGPAKAARIAEALA